jgi:hypothetical protein
MPVAWHQLRIPGPPRALELTAHERTADEVAARFERRAIQHIDIAPGLIDAQEDGRDGRITLIDKASPHALFDLMVADVSPTPPGQAEQAAPSGVIAPAGRLIWQTAASFQRFVEDGEVRRRFGLARGAMNLALNCDPYTQDRESVQALKRFHIHLIYWRESELSQLGRASTLAAETDPYTLRQCLDPVSFIAPPLLRTCLPNTELEPFKARWLSPDDGAVCHGRRPLGALLQLDNWDQLQQPAFEQLVRIIDTRIGQLSRNLLRCLTGAEHPPGKWRRHRLRPLAEIQTMLAASDLDPGNQDALLRLASVLRDLPKPVLERLRRGSRRQRTHSMTLNQPSYSLSLGSQAAADGHPDALEHRHPVLKIQLKLFSGIGGAGLISLPGLPSVRVIRGHGRFSSADWRRRSELQRAFAAYNSEALRQANTLGTSLRLGPIGALGDLRSGWVR